MNELIERLAREAGITMNPAGPSDDGIDTWFGVQYLPSGALVRFAALVAAECAFLAEVQKYNHAQKLSDPPQSSAAVEAAWAIRAAFPMPKP